MLNGGAFVQTVGLGAIGTVTWLETPFRSGAGVQRPAATSLAITTPLTEAIARRHGVSPERVMLSGGSGDVLRAATTVFTGNARALVTGAPGDQAPVHQAIRRNARVVEVPLTADLKLNLVATLARAAGSGLVYICNPNNPASAVVPLAEVAALVAALAASAPEACVLVDEADFAYVDDPVFGTAIPLVEKYPNLIVARALSRIHGIAGTYVGYAIAQEKTLAAMREHTPAPGLSRMGAAAAAASLEEAAGLEKKRAPNDDASRPNTGTLVKAGYRGAASEANFVMVDVRRDSRAFEEARRQPGAGIGRRFPPPTAWPRITVGTRQEMERAIPFFTELLATSPTGALFMFMPGATGDSMTC